MLSLSDRRKNRLERGVDGDRILGLASGDTGSPHVMGAT